MRKIDANQPIQHAIDGHAIDRMLLADGGGNFEMGRGVVEREERGKHRRARLGEAFARFANRILGSGLVESVGVFHSVNEARGSVGK